MQAALAKGIPRPLVGTIHLLSGGYENFGVAGLIQGDACESFWKAYGMLGACKCLHITPTIFYWLGMWNVGDSP
jgi:hypothetical protein